MYLLTGLWPLVSMDTFLAVTGPKTDLWLVRTVGVLVAAVGAGLLAAGVRRTVTLELGFVAAGAAASLAAIDIIYVSLGVIPPIYLADAAVEVPIAVLWLVAGARARGRDPGNNPAAPITGKPTSAAGRP